MPKKRNPNRISELRLSKKWNQSELAEAVGAHWVTISKLERGQMQLTQEWMQRIGKAIGVQPAELIADPSTYRTIYLHGFIEDAGKVLYTSRVPRTDEDPDPAPFAVQFGASQPDSTVWYSIGTESYYPFLRTGDLVRFTYQSSIDMQKATGRLCLVETNEDDPRRIVGVPSRGTRDGLIDVQVHGKPLLRDVPVKELAVMSMAVLEPDMLTDEDGYPLDIWEPEMIGAEEYSGDQKDNSKN